MNWSRWFKKSHTCWADGDGDASSAKKTYNKSKGNDVGDISPFKRLRAKLNRGKGSAVRICFSACYPFLLPSLHPFTPVCSMTADKERFLYYSRSSEPKMYHSRFSTIAYLINLHDISQFLVLVVAFARALYLNKNDSRIHSPTQISTTLAYIS